MKFDTDPSREIEEAVPTVDAYAASRKQEKQEAQVQSESATAENPAGLEEEASEQGAFNPETGEINWDCPCLGGMAHGPCGEEFRAAFSCFVYSEQEPKGLDCIDKFKGMQDCFRAHPEVYAAELEDDDPELEAELAQEREALEKSSSTTSSNGTQPERRLLDDQDSTPLPVSPILSADVPPAKREETSKPSEPTLSPSEAQQRTEAPAPSEPHPQPEAATAASAKDHLARETPKEKAETAAQSAKIASEKFDEDLELMPKAWHDGRDAGEKTEGEKKSKD